MPSNRRKRTSNISLLQRRLEDLAINTRSRAPCLAIDNSIASPSGSGIMEDTVETSVVEPQTKIKKKGIPKDALINTKRLLT